MVSSTPRPHFTPGKVPVPILQEARWALRPVWTGGKFRPHRDSIQDRPARSSVAIPTELPDPHTICNIIAFFTAAVVARTRLSGSFIRTLPVLFAHFLDSKTSRLYTFEYYAKPKPKLECQIIAVIGFSRNVNAFS